MKTLRGASLSPSSAILPNSFIVPKVAASFAPDKVVEYIDKSAVSTNPLGQRKQFQFAQRCCSFENVNLIIKTQLGKFKTMTDADDKNINTTDADDKNVYITDADDKKKLVSCTGDFEGGGWGRLFIKYIYKGLYKGPAEGRLPHIENKGT